MTNLLGDDFDDAREEEYRKIKLLMSWKGIQMNDCDYKRHIEYQDGYIEELILENKKLRKQIKESEG